MKSSLGKGCLLSAVCCLFLLSCAPKKVAVPVPEGVSLKDMLAEGEGVTSLESTFHIEFEREGSIMKGDAVLRLTPDTLDMQVYSLGFLVAEITSNGSEMKSSPAIDKGRLSMLVEGIRNSFLWWSLKNPEIREDDGAYRVSNSWRKLVIDKKTMMPEKQTIELEEGRQLFVSYAEPASMDGTWFPSKMKIELMRQSVNLEIRTLSLTPPSFLRRDRDR